MVFLKLGLTIQNKKIVFVSDPDAAKRYGPDPGRQDPDPQLLSKLMNFYINKKVPVPE